MNKKQLLQDKINEILSVKGSSQNELARQMGCSAATIISIKKGKWEDVSEEMIARLYGYLKLDTWKLRNTWNLQSIQKVCDEATEGHKMFGVAGYTGAGKTTALKHYSNRNPNAYYVLATVLHTKKAFLQAIQKSMGISTGTSLQDMMIGITRKLNSKEGSLLIIDDAGKLSHTTLRLVQVIYDETEFNAGIILAGTEFLKEEIDKLARKNKMGFRELRRRISYWQAMKRPSKKVVMEICKQYEIKDSKSVSYIITEANNYGTLKNIIVNATKMAAKVGIGVSREILESINCGDHKYEYEHA